MICMYFLLLQRMLDKHNKSVYLKNQDEKCLAFCKTGTDQEGFEIKFINNEIGE